MAKKVPKKDWIYGYCKLCREKELELFNYIGKPVVGIRMHRRACKEAGCLHPPDYGTQDEVDDIQLIADE